MAEIDDKITEVMREMARRRWSKVTPEGRKEFGKFLTASRIKKPENPPLVMEDVPPDISLPAFPLGGDAGRVFCFRCESGYHDRCLDKGEGFECYCRRKLDHQA
jgi:hypothetical protein